jgi:hypothetical protein
MMPPDYKGGGVVRFMAAAEGYVMVRRPGRAVFVVDVARWNSWPECDGKGKFAPTDHSRPENSHDS